MKKDIINRKMIALALASSVAPISLWAGTSNVLSLDNNKVDNTDFKVFTDSSKVFDIDEVVVVSQPKENFRLRQQSLSSTSVGGFQIQKLGTRDLRELSSYIPNFVMPNYGSRLSSAMYVRGIGSRVNSPAVGIYLDGIPVLSKSAFNLHHYQTSRIDVLRGPQATLYGQNTEGGLVRIYSRNPFEYEGTDLKLGYGSRYYRNVELAHYHRINDHLAFTVAAFNDAQKGFFRNTNTGSRADKYNEAGGKIVLKAKLNRGWNVDLLANYQYVDQNGFPYGKLDLETGKAALPSTTFDGTYLRHSFISGVTVNHTGADYSFASTTSYQYLKDKMNMDQDYLPTDYMSILQEQLQNSLTQEFTLKSNRAVGGFWNWTAGGFFSYQWLKTNGPVFFNEGMTQPIGNAIQQQMYNAMLNVMAQKMMEKGMPEMVAKAAAAKAIEKAGGVSMNVNMGAPGLYHTPQWNLGFFHESNFNITDRLTATLGLRYDLMHTAIHYDASAYMQMSANVMGKKATYVLDSSLDHEVSDDYGQLLPKFGLNLKIDELGSNVYATVSKGYRAGGYNIQMFSDVLQTELNANRNQAMRGDYHIPHTEEDYQRIDKTIAYKPETSWNYEAGAHLNLFDHMLHIDLSAFYMKVTNQQLSVMAGNYGFGRMMVNAGKSHSCGIEAALTGQLFDGKFDWAMSYGYTRSKFDKYVDGEGEDAVDYKGKYVPYVPQHTMAAMADYRLTDWLTLGANVNAQGKTYWDNANTYSQKLYAVLGAHIDLNFKAFNVSFWGRNLTDTNYNTFAVDNSATGTKEYFAQRGNPFQCGVDVRFHF
jgi:iron complex outermembrane receptor protein